MNLNQLFYFKKLSELQNFTKAAEALYITQPSLSYSIKNLEEELNTPLFEKSGRNMILTKYGQVFLEYINRSLDELEKGTQFVKNYGSPSYGHIDLAFIYTTGHQFIPELVSNFSSIEENKNITFSLEQNTSREVIRLLKEGKCDIAFSSYIENEKDLIFIPVMEEELVLIVSKHHPLSAYNDIDLIEAKQYPFILYGEESGLHNYIKDIFNRSGFEPKVKCSIQEDHTICGFVEHDYGISIIPKIHTLSSFNIVPIKIKKPKIERLIYLVYKKSRRLAPAPQKFLDYILSIYKNNLKNK